MVKAFVMVNVNFDEKKDVLDALNKIEGLKICPVYGVYDIVVEVNAKDMSKFKEIITWKIRQIPGVRRTCTSIVDED